MHTRKRYYLITTIIRNKDNGDIKTDTDAHTCMRIHTYAYTNTRTHTLTTSTERIDVLMDLLLPYHLVLLVTQVVAMVIMGKR